MKSFTIAVDLDNTIVDHLGQGVRPGMVAFLDKLKARGHTLILFTSSTRDRALVIMRDFDLAKYFTRKVFREDYDPENAGVSKDLRLFGAEILIDDDPGHIAYVKSIGLCGLLISAYRGGRSDKKELDRILRQIEGLGSPLRRLTSVFRK